MSKSSDIKRASMPSVKTLIDYYSGESVYHDGDYHEGGEAYMEENGVESYLWMFGKGATCMACGFYKGIQRCHITPLCSGGDNSPKNIHLLCRNCHVDSEFLIGEAYWKWMRHVNTTKYKNWILRVIESIEIETGKPATPENLKEYWHKKLRRKEEAA